MSYEKDVWICPTLLVKCITISTMAKRCCLLMLPIIPMSRYASLPSAVTSKFPACGSRGQDRNIGVTDITAVEKVVKVCKMWE